MMSGITAGGAGRVQDGGDGEAVPPVFAALLSTLAQVFAKEGRAGGDLAARELQRAASGAFRAGSRTADPAEALTAACQAVDAHPAVRPVQHCQHLFAWECWGGGVLDDAVSDRLFTVELVGPDGHVASDVVRVGLLVSEARTDYPVSSHSGEETYCVLSGVAEWTLDNGPYVAMPVGTFVHHPAFVPHGRRTGKSPFLGAWRWSGDLALSTFSVQ